MNNPSVTTYTFRVKVGDLEYPGEFSDEMAAKAFANGARFVLDNSAPRNANYYEPPSVTITTYANTYNFTTDTDETTIASQKVI